MAANMILGVAGIAIGALAVYTSLFGTKKRARGKHQTRRNPGNWWLVGVDRRAQVAGGSDVHQEELSA